ncbi:MAG: DUF3052 domain-containing protein [Planctomycetota bacterium]
MPAGYSGTPLPKKLGIKEEHRVLLCDAPKDFERTLGRLPADVELKRDLRGKRGFDVIVLFAPNAAALERRLDACIARLNTAGGLWIAWPKKSSGLATDLGDGPVRKRGLATGLVDNKVCAVDEVWSGLRFVRRLKDR